MLFFCGEKELLIQSVCFFAPFFGFFFLKFFGKKKEKISSFSSGKISILFTKKKNTRETNNYLLLLSFNDFDVNEEKEEETIRW